MARRLPPLNALKAFEATARHLSFTKAADELFVTQAAVSHQIKTLETFLGLALFKRLNRSLMLTDEGQILFPAMSEALELIMLTTDRLHRHQQSGMLNVATMDSLAANWLVPRLGRFRRANPDIDVRVSTSDQLVDYARDGIDLGIRYGRGDWPGMYVTHLMTEEVFPVCSPKLLAEGPPLNTPNDLKHYTLLHDDMREDWRMWLMAVGATEVNPTRGPGFKHSNFVYQAAVVGDGVALGRSVLVADELEQGRLVKVLDFALPANYAYWIVSPRAATDNPKVKLFRDWLLAEATER
ncbi:MAG: transcriptional regulator GcvA [Rhodospirillales bacterium]|nr:transcriptional regulator GcvA [Rhodospirillales bacterium]